MGDYHDLHVISDTLLLVGVFDKFKDKCIEIYGLDPLYFLSAPGLAQQACLEEVNLELLTDNHMLLMIEEGIRGRMCQSTHRYAKANNKYMKNYDKNIESSYLTYLAANKLYGWAMSQKLPVNGFRWVNDVSRFNEDFIKITMKIVMQDISLKQMQSIQKNYLVLIKSYHFNQKKKRLGQVEKLVCSIEDKEKQVTHIRALKQVLNHGLILKEVNRD